jgi:hypothetical protein
MVTPDPTAKARKELDRLAASYTAAESKADEHRGPLRAAIVRHLMERNAPPGLIAKHTPYDRVHINRIGREAGVPPLTGPNATGPAPTYDEETQAKALAELDELSKPFTKANSKAEDAREALHAAIVRHYTERTLPPGELAKHTPYDRNHIHRIAKAAGAPKLRPKKD